MRKGILDVIITNMPVPFEIIEHTADLRLRVTGQSPQELFANALKGMAEIIKPGLGDGADTASLGASPSASFRASRQFSVSSVDQAALLVDFLNEALYLGNVHKEIYTSVEFSAFGDTRCEGKLKAVAVQGFDRDIKAATYHDLAITRRPDGYLEATIVLDI